MRTLLSSGVVAFGSLLVALCKVLRLILAWCSKKAKESKADQFFLVRWGLAIVNFLAYILEQFVMKVNK